MSTTTLQIDDSIPLVTLVRALASQGLTVVGDRRGGLMVTQVSRAACTEVPHHSDTTEGAGGALSLPDEDYDDSTYHQHSGRFSDNSPDELRADDDRQRARDVNDERRLLGL